MAWLSLKTVINLGIIAFYLDRTTGEIYFRLGRGRLRKMKK